VGSPPKDKLEAVPVDTHVWQIAVRDYGLDLQGKALTPRIYQSIGDHFRSMYGAHAGWAHSVHRGTGAWCL
jgi:N-glycosylase/DNA lyase